MGLPLTACLARDTTLAAYARELFKPWKDSLSLVVGLKKTFEIWVWAFRWMLPGLGYVLLFLGFSFATSSTR